MPTTEVSRSADVNEACHRFLDSFQCWVEGCIDQFAEAPPVPNDNDPQDGHDQLTYTTSWATLIRHRDHDGALAFMKQQRDLVAGHQADIGAWQHGYWKRQEAHHGTEHYELFLSTLLDLDPHDTVTLNQLTDAAEHFGNWVTDVPAFFDWDTGLFRSVYLGTEHIGTRPGEYINTPDHFRFINIALRVHAATGEQRYLDLATAHTARWAEAITVSEKLPLALLTSGPVIDFAGEQAEAYRGFAGAAGINQAETITDVDRAENYLASNAIPTLLAMWCHTGVDLYRRAAEALIDPLVSQLPDPDAGALSALVRVYRSVTNDTRYDAAVLEAADAVNTDTIHLLTLDPDQRLGRGGGGVGKRGDMPRWTIDADTPRPVSPMLLALASEIDGDDGRALLAVDLAHAHFRLAAQCLRPGRHHGCSAQTVSAVARGHGRDNDAGMVTAVLEPVLQRFGSRDAEPALTGA